jgi:hypothetical protein
MKKVGASHADLVACGFAILVVGTSPAARSYLVAPGIEENVPHGPEVPEK